MIVVDEDIKKLVHFFNSVLIRLSLYGWQLRLTNSSEGFCWKQRKIIDIGINYRYPKELILHEIAHILTCRFCNQKHNFIFWKTFDDLVRRFLPNHAVSEAQVRHRSYATKGFYRRVYER